MTLEDQCRVLEAQLTETERQEAFAFMRANGWTEGKNPPAWVWRKVFWDIIGRRTEKDKLDALAETVDGRVLN